MAETIEMQECRQTGLTPSQIIELQADYEACKRDLEEIMRRLVIPCDYCIKNWNCALNDICQPQWRGRSKENE